MSGRYTRSADGSRRRARDRPRSPGRGILVLLREEPLVAAPLDFGPRLQAVGGQAPHREHEALPLDLLFEDRAAPARRSWPFTYRQSNFMKQKRLESAESLQRQGSPNRQGCQGCAAGHVALVRPDYHLEVGHRLGRHGPFLTLERGARGTEREFLTDPFAIRTRGSGSAPPRQPRSSECRLGLLGSRRPDQWDGLVLRRL